MSDVFNYEPNSPRLVLSNSKDARRARMKSLLILFYRSVEGEEIGMLEDMEVGITDLQRVAFQITEAKTDDLSDLQPLVCGRR